MLLRIKVAARAAAQVRNAAEWWAANRPSAPDAIASDFGASVALLARQPGIGARYNGARAGRAVPLPRPRGVFRVRPAIFLPRSIRHALCRRLRRARAAGEFGALTLRQRYGTIDFIACAHPCLSAISAKCHPRSR